MFNVIYRAYGPDAELNIDHDVLLSADTLHIVHRPTFRIHISWLKLQQMQLPLLGYSTIVVQGLGSAPLARIRLIIIPVVDQCTI